MPVLPAKFIEAFEAPQPEAKLIWLVQLTLFRGTDVLPPVITRLCKHHEEVDWPLGHPGSVPRWYPFPFSHSGFKANTQGDLQVVDLTIDNTQRVLMPWLHDTNGLEGMPVEIFLVPSNALDLVWPAHEAWPQEGHQLTVLSASADASSVMLRMGEPNYLQVNSPADRYTMDTCKHPFGSEQCGYVINEFGAFESCRRRVGDCKERNLDHIARGLPAVVLGNFGGHPGMTRLSR